MLQAGVWSVGATNSTSAPATTVSIDESGPDDDLITNDNAANDDGNRASTCSESEFQCTNGECISDEWVCDLYDDCSPEAGSESDEETRVVCTAYNLGNAYTTEISTEAKTSSVMDMTTTAVETDDKTSSVMDMTTSAVETADDLLTNGGGGGGGGFGSMLALGICGGIFFIVVAVGSVYVFYNPTPTENPATGQRRILSGLLFILCLPNFVSLSFVRKLRVHGHLILHL
jgi:hypothetical protein